MGHMAETSFGSISKSLRAFSPPPSIIFGCFGELLFHLHIAEMVAAMKKLGSPVELITNATLRSRDLAVHLKEAGLDVLWVYLDAATTPVYGDVRLGAYCLRY